MKHLFYLFLPRMHDLSKSWGNIRWIKAESHPTEGKVYTFETCQRHKRKRKTEKICWRSLKRWQVNVTHILERERDHEGKGDRELRQLVKSERGLWIGRVKLFTSWLGGLYKRMSSFSQIHTRMFRSGGHHVWNLLSKGTEKD